MTAILAIDQGTTGSTALVFSQEGEILGSAYSEFTQHYPHPGWVEHDPEEIWQVSLKVSAEALAASGIAKGDLSGIGITNQRETAIVWDRVSGQAVHRAVVWQSSQSAGICERLKSDGLEPLFRQKTGLFIEPYFSGSKIRWILDSDPGLQRRADAGELAFGTVDSWLLWKLTGGRSTTGAQHRTDPTNASRTLLYDIHRQEWDRELCEIFNVPVTMLPEVRPSAGRFGETCRLDGIPAGIPIAGIAGDQQAALFGQGCREPGQAKNTYGTGCFLLMNMGQQHPVSPNGLLTTICCDANGAPAYALEGSIFIAGAAVQWLRDELKIIGDASETESLAQEIDDNEGVYLVPAFAGLGAPYWDMKARCTGRVDPRFGPRSPGPGSPRSHRLPDPGYRGRHEPGFRCRAEGITRRRGRIQEQFPDAIPGRFAGRNPGPAETRGNHGRGQRLPRRPGHRRVEEPLGTGRHQEYRSPL
jgi:glycerol kinase